MKIALIGLTILTMNTIYSQKHLKLNEPAPKISVTDWILNIPKDKTFENKYIVLEFWASWCSGCLESVPHLNEIQSKFNREDLYFVSLTDEKVENVLSISKKVKFNSIVISDQKKNTQRLFGNRTANITLPLTILIDKNGIIKWIGIPALLNENIIRDLLNNNLIPFNLFGKPND
jgi:thiol-disulfide isomerase/thioredoxin